MRGTSETPASTSPFTPVLVSSKALSSVTRSYEASFVVSIAFSVYQITDQSDNKLNSQRKNETVFMGFGDKTSGYSKTIDQR